MKRPFRRFGVLCLAGALAGGAGCNPDHSVKPGAPVLTEVAIVEGGGATITSIPAGNPTCPVDAVGGGVCDPASTTVPPVCFQATLHNWCRCMAATAPMPPPTPPTCTDGGVAGAAGGAGGAAGGITGSAGVTGGLGGAAGGLAGLAGAAGGAAGPDGGAAGGAAAGASGADAGTDAPPPPAAGNWDCDPFSPTAQVLFIFDRLIDTKPLGDAGAQTAVATIMSGATPIAASTDYTPNGTPGQIIFPAFGDFRADGPSVLVSASTALPGNAPVTVALDKTKVLAKDGKTPFDGTNFGGGSLTFLTSAFSAAVAVPAAPASTDPCVPTPTTAPLDATGSITFNSPVDPAAVMTAVTVKSGTTTVPVTLSSMDNLTFTITPATADMKWPANANLSIEVPGTLADLAGDTLGAAQSVPFTTGAQ